MQYKEIESAIEAIKANQETDIDICLDANTWQEAEALVDALKNHAQEFADALKDNTALRRLHLYYHIKPLVADQYMGENLIQKNVAIHAEKIGEALKVNTTLESLELISDHLTDTAANHIYAAFQNNSALKTLRILGKSVGKEHTTALADLFNPHSKLKNLQLGTSVGKLVAGDIANALMQNHMLESLDLISNELGVDGAKALATLLRTNNTLKDLNLHESKIGADGAVALADALRTNHGLVSLNLGLSKIGFEGATKILAALTQNTSVKSLYLAANYNCVTVEYPTKPINDEMSLFTHQLCETLSKNQTLTYIDISNNPLNIEAVHQMAEGLRVNETLISLNLEYNQMNDQMVSKIADVLQDSNTTLKNLNLCWNNIKANGAKAIADALEGGAKLESLNLSDNMIGIEGAKAIAQALKVNKVLTSLNLQNTHINPEGAIHIVKALEMNQTLTHIDLRFNPVSASEIADMLKFNYALTSLEFDQTNIRPDVQELITSRLARNKLIADVRTSISEANQALSELMSPGDDTNVSLLLGDLEATIQRLDNDLSQLSQYAAPPKHLQSNIAFLHRLSQSLLLEGYDAIIRTCLYAGNISAAEACYAALKNVLERDEPSLAFRIGFDLMVGMENDEGDQIMQDLNTLSLQDQPDSKPNLRARYKQALGYLQVAYDIPQGQKALGRLAIGISQNKPLPIDPLPEHIKIIPLTALVQALEKAQPLIKQTLEEVKPPTMQRSEEVEPPKKRRRHMRRGLGLKLFDKGNEDRDPLYNALTKMIQHADKLSPSLFYELCATEPFSTVLKDSLGTDILILTEQMTRDDFTLPASTQAATRDVFEIFEKCQTYLDTQQTAPTVEPIDSPPEPNKGGGPQRMRF